jgi:hypothetical protein
VAGAVSVAAELARCRTSGRSPARAATSSASTKTAACCPLTGWSGPPSAKAKWLQTPVTRTWPEASALAAAAHRSGQSRGVAPPRDSPVSALSCTRAGTPTASAAAASASSWATEYAPTSTPAATAGPAASPGVVSQASSGTCTPAARSARASSRKAQPSQAAPPSTAARALSTRPCP